MPRNEDYLDSLLDSVTEISSKVEQNGARNTGDSFRNEAQFLDEFEEEIARDLENKASRELVDEFERSLGLLPSDDADNDVDILKNISIETEPKGYQNDSEFSEDISHEELLSDLAGILGGDADTDIEIPIDTSLPKEAPKNENEDIISDVEEVISDIEDEKEAVNENVEEDYSQDLAKNLSSILEKSDETVKDTQSGGVTDNKDAAFEEAVSETQEASPEDSFRQEDDIPDIGSLLDSFNGDSKDTEPLSKEDSLDETASLENGNDAGEENEDKKPSVIGKLLEKIKAIFTPKPEEEESSENEESKLSEEIEGESPKDIKAAKKKAKKEEKERKKAEKEKAKKKAAEERALKKAEKEKNRVPDNSPKIPITVIAAFVILSASIIV